jgi:glutamate-1-semialdehyde 2,1-aminomutase
VTAPAMQRSAQLYARAQGALAGGVASAGKYVFPQPVYAASSSGAEVVDVDGNRYVDLLMGVGVNILGHNHPAVLQSLRRQLETGLFTRMATESEIELAELIQACMPHVERMRFATSGMEAAMMAARVARAWTGRPRIAKFEGNVHGQHDGLAFSGHRKFAGSVDAPAPVRDSAGLWPGLEESVLILPFNDLTRAADLIERNHADLAAVLIEPVAGYGIGALPADQDFLAGMREITQQYGILLIWDEIVTGFRVGLGGMADLVGHQPDLTLLGKVMGGGLPLAAFGGRADVMEGVLGVNADPGRKVSHAGTFVGHPLAMASGIAVIEELRRTNPYPALNASGEQLRNDLLTSAQRAGLDVQVTGIGSFFQVHFTSKPIRDVRDSVAADQKAQQQFAHQMIEAGVYLLPNHPGFLSTAHDDRHLAAVRSAADHVFTALAVNAA